MKFSVSCKHWSILMRWEYSLYTLGLLALKFWQVSLNTIFLVRIIRSTNLNEFYVHLLENILIFYISIKCTKYSMPEYRLFPLFVGHILRIFFKEYSQNMPYGIFLGHLWGIFSGHLWRIFLRTSMGNIPILDTLSG